MRNHARLLAFQKADALVAEIYRSTARFPPSEEFGLKSQMRRAAVSAAVNIVEGCARDSEADFLRFLGIACGSAKELAYEAALAHRLGLLPAESAAGLLRDCEDSVRVLSRLRRGFARAIKEQVRTASPDPTGS